MDERFAAVMFSPRKLEPVNFILFRISRPLLHFVANEVPEGFETFVEERHQKPEQARQHQFYRRKCHIFSRSKIKIFYSANFTHAMSLWSPTFATEL